MNVRKGELKDIDTIMKIYRVARQYMVEHGNPDQWADGHPSRELILDDIKKGICHVVIKDDTICGVFAFLFGQDPTYKVIEGGNWLNDNPYGTIHRIASDGKTGGILKCAISYGLSQISDVRIDTYKDNIKMQTLLKQYGFTKCGTIYLENGDPRIAYHYTK